MHLLGEVERIVSLDGIRQWSQTTVRSWRRKGSIFGEVRHQLVLAGLKGSPIVRPFLGHGQKMALSLLQCL